MTQHPICDYENSDYQSTFWDSGTRRYEDQCESRVLARLMPKQGRLLLEAGAGAGRNTLRYIGFERIVLLDYSRTQLFQARERLGESRRFLFVAANVYAIPFAASLFDAATMIRTLHHLSDPPAALREIRRVLRPKSHFLLEYANKRNTKAVLRYFLHRQMWNPFSPEAVEYLPLNFNFHPASVRRWLAQTGFSILNQATVSHFRIGFLKRRFPARLLSLLDLLLGYTGNLWQLSPSVFVLSRTDSSGPPTPAGFFRCPECGHTDLEEADSSSGRSLNCRVCRRRYPIRNGIYDFKEPLTL
ncbi:MAG: methyltransferase domain-containing protein [Anaerolineales bacterium]|nr:methyltransferase domain-containing protein [Anaerolineales bacterium]